MSGVFRQHESSLDQSYEKLLIDNLLFPAFRFALSTPYFMKCLSSLFYFKDVIAKELQSHIVHLKISYKFSCGNSNVTYYGKAEHQRSRRSSEHLGISHLTGKRVECKPSAVSDYLLLHNHDSDLYYPLSI